MGLSRGISRSFAGSTPLLVLGGGLSVGVGMATLAFTRSRRLGRPTSRVLALGWLPAAVAVVLTVVASTTAPGWFVSRTTAAPVAAAPVPTSVAHESWSTPVTGIRELIAAGAGVVLSNNREIEALDGSTGRVRWPYARHGTVPLDLIASPDRRTVAFELERATGNTDLATQTVVLDAFTGRTRITYAEPKNPHGLPSPYLTDDSLIVGTGLGFDQPTHVFRAISLASGRTAWTYTDPTNCPDSNNPAYAAVPGGLLIAHACDGGPAITLFDGASGAKKWTVPWPNTVMLSLTPDGRYLAGRRDETGYRLPRTSGGQPRPIQPHRHPHRPRDPARHQHRDHARRADRAVGRRRADPARPAHPQATDGDSHGSWRPGGSPVAVPGEPYRRELVRASR